MKALEERAAVPLQQHPLYQAGQSVEQFGKETLAPAPGFEKSWTRDIGSGLGSMASGVGLSLIPMAGPALAGSVFLGAGMGEAVDRAINAGATEEQAIRAARLGAIAGATDVVDALIPMLGSTGKVLGFVKRVGTRAIYSAFAEGGQEGVQQLIQNAISKGIDNIGCASDGPKPRGSNGLFLGRTGINGAVYRLSHSSPEKDRTGQCWPGHRNKRQPNAACH